MNLPAHKQRGSGPAKPTLTRLTLPLLLAVTSMVAQAGQVPVVPPITVVVPPPPAPPPVPVSAPVVPTPAPPTPALPVPAVTPDTGSSASVSVRPVLTSADLKIIESLKSVPVSALTYSGMREADSLINTALERPDLPESVKAGLLELREDIETELAGWN